MGNIQIFLCLRAAMVALIGGSYCRPRKIIEFLLNLNCLGHSLYCSSAEFGQTGEVLSNEPYCLHDKTPSLWFHPHKKTFFCVLFTTVLFLQVQRRERRRSLGGNPWFRLPLQGSAGGSTSLPLQGHTPSQVGRGSHPSQIVHTPSLVCGGNTRTF